MTIIYVVLALLLGIIIGFLIGAFLMKVTILNEINKQVETNQPIVNSLISELDKLINIVKSSKTVN